MHLTYEEREELKALSKEIFGKTSFWGKLVRRGTKDPKTKEITYYTDFDSIKNKLLEFKDNTAKIMAELKATQTENPDLTLVYQPVK